jgi:hypothetical protein
MSVETIVRERSESCVVQPRTGGHPCPACGGVLVPLRSAWRCSRCYFSLCAGCEPQTSVEREDD